MPLTDTPPPLPEAEPPPADDPSRPPPATRLPRARVSPRMLAVLKFAGLLAVGLALRLQVASEWHAPAGDGLHYFALSQQLILDDRYAYGPGGPLTWTRLPGYPLFLAHVAVREAPLPLEAHLQAATRANVLLDVGTAVLVALLVRRRGGGVAAGLAAVAGVLTCPVLLVLSCYGLTESLATFLGTATIYAVTVAMEGRLIGGAALAGLGLGLSLLVRADAVTLLPALAVALLGARGPRRRRVLAAAVCALVAAAVFAPWPARNLARFGEAHPFGSHFVSQDGGALPSAPLRWMNTWADGRHYEGYLIFLLAWQRPLTPNAISPQMYDSDEERARLVALFERYNREQHSPEVAAAFDELARERARRAPLRTWVTLPLIRLAALWAPLPEPDFPMRSSLLQLPAGRPLFAVLDGVLFALAVAGAVALLFVGGRAGRLTLLVIGSTVAARCAFYVLLHPSPVQRYLAGIFPLLIAAAAIGIDAAARWHRARVGDRPAGSR